MAKVNIKSSNPITPKIYAYTTPNYPKHDGYVKIGYTEQDVEKRIKDQSGTIDIETRTEWVLNACFEDDGKLFKDHDVHKYLIKLGYERMPKLEWFYIEPKEAKHRTQDFRENHGIIDGNKVIDYTLREEQKKAVDITMQFYNEHKSDVKTNEFLWNAKPRFGKTLTVYDFCKSIGAKKVLIVTNRPAIANSWYNDYTKFIGTDNYRFISEVEEIKNNPLCMSRNDYVNYICNTDDECPFIEFVSLQNLKGGIEFGGNYDKLGYIAELDWDVLVVDEAHEGVDTYKTDFAFDKIKRNFTLHLSGTPFKAIANDKFSQNAIFDWTYEDEQVAKRDYKGEGSNPYADMPQINLFTYKMSDIVTEQVSEGMEIDGEKTAFAFDLNEFFSTKDNKIPTFTYDKEVDKFLDALTTQKKFPFSTEELRDELKHTFWFLDRVDSAKALERKLKHHPIFKDYEVILAAGDGKSVDDEEKSNAKAYYKVIEAIKKYDKTITLSVGQLTTGITVPEWTAVLMLCNVKTPSLYMQAAFRAQNPHVFEEKSIEENRKIYKRKEKCYVFDFDPARTLTIFDNMANGLYSSTSNGRGDTETRKRNIGNLLNFFPVIGEDSEGEMIELDAENVLSIPRKIYAKQVVRSGFMSDFLFQNISNVFHAPSEIADILRRVPPVTKQDANIMISEEARQYYDDEGNISESNIKTIAIGKDQEFFASKKYETLIDVTSAEKAKEDIETIKANPISDTGEEQSDFVKNLIVGTNTKVQDIFEEHIKGMSKSNQNRLQNTLERNMDKLIDNTVRTYQTNEKIIDRDYDKKIKEAQSEQEEIALENERQKKKEENIDNFVKKIEENQQQFVDDSVHTIHESVIKDNAEKEKKNIESSIKDHLRGFSRTIPSFLMAYGDENTTLETFEQNIPDDVFKGVTSITIEDFKFLRDGGDYTDEVTGETKHYEGKLFEPVVFNDSIKEFMSLKDKLADYFSEDKEIDIFDYIPPQKNNQIFTPKWVVKKMVDILEEENPNCFDDPDKTFIDLYMKSGLYITEIVKRLFRSEKMKAIYPNEKDRLKHIFEKQVYGLAPTEIIYEIAKEYIFGFSDNIDDIKHNIVQADATESAKAGTLNKFLDELYGKE